MPHPHVVAERSHAGYVRVLLSRPERRNALDPGMVTALTEVMRDAGDAVVLLGSTDPQVFCAGADLAIPGAERAVVSDLLYECYEHIITRPGPVIAVLRGPAVGGGAQLAAAADLRIVSPAARLRWAGPPGAGLAVGAWILPDLAGRGAALEIAMTGRWVGAAEALALGLVNRIDDDPDRAAFGLAETLAGLGPQAAGKIKAIASAGGLLDRLRAERLANRAAWEQMLGRGTG
jgi:enoyl-CoA hydratase/carnithine racemase